ncbi:MAG: hypothetical protein M1839_001121 [Geoglossum umbratile]|nr:MAG: hypothetical protein M1839_001121 [Geoglossum umbratile]
MKSNHCPTLRQHGSVRNPTATSSPRRFFTEREDTIFGLTLQKAGIEAALTTKEEELRKSAAKSAARVLKYEEALKRKDEKIARLTVDVVEYDAALKAQVKETESMAAKLVAACAEIEDLKKVKTENGSKIETLNSHAISLRIDKRELKQRLEVALGETKQCRTEIIQLKDRHMQDLEDSLDMITSLKTQVNRLQSQNEAKDRIAGSEVNKLKMETDRDFALLNELINNLQKENAEESNKANARTTKLALERDFWKSRCKEVEHVASEAEALKTEVESLRGKASDAEQTVARANQLELEVQELHHREAESQVMASRIESLESENQALKDTAENATQLRASRAEAGAEVEGWMREVGRAAASDESTSQIKALELENQKLKNMVEGSLLKFTQITILQAEAEQWKQEIEKRARSEGDLASQIESLESENQRLKSVAGGAQQNATQITVLQAELEARKRETEESLRNVGDMASQIEFLEVENQRLKTMADGAQQNAVQIAVLQAELEAWKRETEERVTNEKAMASRVESLESENRILKSELGGAQQKLTQVTDLQMEVEQWKREAQENVGNKRDAASQIESLESENQILKNKLDETRQKVAQIMTLREEVEQWKRQNEKRIKKESVRQMDDCRVREGEQLNEEQKNAIEAALKETADENEKMKKDLRDAGEDIKSLVYREGKLKETIHVQDMEISALQVALGQQRDRSSRDRRESRDQRTEAKRALLNFEAEHECELNALKASLREHGEKVAHLEEALVKKDDDMVGMKRCVEEVKQKVTDVTRQYAAALDGARLLRRKLDSYKEKLESYEFKVKTVRPKAKIEKTENIRIKEDREQTNCEAEMWHSRGRQQTRRARVI